jgi:hypothetical protein
LFVAAWAACLSGPALAASSDAPMRLESGGVFGGLFLEVTAADARVLDHPELEVRYAISNDWSTPMDVVRGSDRVSLQADAQTDALGLFGRVPWARVFGAGPLVGQRPLWERLSTSVETRASLRWGGWTDRPIEAWHRLIIADRSERPLYPRDAVHLTLRDTTTGAGVALRSSRAALGDLVLRTQYLAAEGGGSATDAGRARWGVSARLDLKVPTGSPASLGGSGGWDVGVALLATAELTPWLTLHLLTAASAVSPLALDVPLQPLTWHGTAELSLAVRLWGLAFLVEDRFTTAIFQGGWQRVPAKGIFKATGYYAAFLPQNFVRGGVRWEAWTFWFAEDWTPGRAAFSPGGMNWFHTSNAPDIAVGVTYSVR